MIPSFFRYSFLCAALAMAALPAADPSSPSAHTFSIGPDAFVLDGKPLVIRSGEIDFTRVPREYWQHRLKMCRALGLNAVTTALFWNVHEPKEGQFTWDGQADAAEFCRLAQAEGLWVIVRVGPYSYGDWDMGGLPWWLLAHEHVAVRSCDPAFLLPAERYLKEVGRILAPLQVTQGGPIILAQIESEYGFYGKDPAYMGALRQAATAGGITIPLIAHAPRGTTKRGSSNGLLYMINCRTGGVAKAFEALRQAQPTGPLMIGGYCFSDYASWGKPNRLIYKAKAIADDLETMLGSNQSFILYAAHGGTSFGLWAGSFIPFDPMTSSYDFSAPIDESGQPGPLFSALREAMIRHAEPGETIPTPPPSNPLVRIPAVTLSESVSLYANLPEAHQDRVPRPMEAYGQGFGCVLYRTTLPPGPAGALSVKSANDVAWVRLDGKNIGMMDRRTSRFRVKLPARTVPAELDILVEAMGRIAIGHGLADRKGLIAPVTVTSDAGSKEVTDWKVFSLPLDDAMIAGLSFTEKSTSGPAFWHGTFSLAEVGDTFLDMQTWGKGVVWINGHCLGRFWNIGPTQTAYVPGPWLKAGANDVVVLDLIGPSKPVLAGLLKPILNERHPERDLWSRTRAKGTLALPSSTADGHFTPETQWQTAAFPHPATGRYVALEFYNAHDGKSVASMAEMELVDANGTALFNGTWNIIWVDSEARDGAVENIIDGKVATSWSTANDGRTGFPHRFVIDLGESKTIGGLRYLPRGGGPDTPGRIKDWRAFVSDQPFGLIVDPAKK